MLCVDAPSYVNIGGEEIYLSCNAARNFANSFSKYEPKQNFTTTPQDYFQIPSLYQNLFPIDYNDEELFGTLLTLSIVRGNSFYQALLVGIEILELLHIQIIPGPIKTEIYKRAGSFYFPTTQEKVAYEFLQMNNAGIKAAFGYLTETLQFEPPKAAELLFKFMLLSKSKDIHILTADDVKFMVSKRLSYDKLEFILREAAHNVGKEKSGRFFAFLETIQTTKPLFTNPGEYSFEQLDKQVGYSYDHIQRTQEKLKEHYGKLTVSVLEKIIAEVEQQNKKEGMIEIQIAPGETISVDSKVFRKYIAELKKILKTIKAQGKLPDIGIRIINSLTDTHPGIARATAMTTQSLNEDIACSEKGLDLIALALDPTSETGRMLRLALNIAGETPDIPVRIDMPGGDTSIIWWNKKIGFEPTLMAKTNSNNLVGPFTFYETKVVQLQESTTPRNIPALLIVDRRGRYFVVSIDEVRSIISLAKKIKAGGIVEKGKADALLRIVDDFFAAWESVDWKSPDAGLNLEEVTTQTNLKRAKTFSKLRQGYELLRTRRQIAHGLSDLRNLTDPASFAKAVQTSKLQFIERYQDFFIEGYFRETFLKEAELFFKDILDGRPKEISKSKARLKDIIFKQMNLHVRSKNSRFIGNVRTINFVDELLGLVQLGKKGIEHCTSAEIEDVTMYRVNEMEEPSLNRARELFLSGKEKQAYAEYARVNIEPKTAPEVRLQALLGMLRTARFLGDPARLSIALSGLEYYVMQGETLSEEVVAELSRTAEQQKWLQGVAIPEELAKAANLSNGNGAKTTAAIGTSQVPQYIPTDVKNIIGQITSFYIENLGLTFLDEATLQTILFYNYDQYMEFRRKTQSNLTGNAERTALLETLDKYYREARNVLGYYEIIVELPETPNLLFDADTIEPFLLGERIKWRTNKIKNNAFEIWNTSQPFRYSLKQVSSNAMVGATTFVVAEKFTTMILPEPKNQLEATLLGYDVLTTAMVADMGTQRLVAYLTSAATTGYAMPIPTFVSQLGWAMVGFKGLNMVNHDLLGFDSEAANLLSLFELGFVYGANSYVKNIYPSSIFSVPQNASKLTTLSGIAILAATLELELGNAIYSTHYLKPAEAYVRDKTYADYGRMLKRYSFWGNGDANIFERLASSYLYVSYNIAPNALGMISADYLDCDQRIPKLVAIRRAEEKQNQGLVLSFKNQLISNLALQTFAMLNKKIVPPKLEDENLLLQIFMMNDPVSIEDYINDTLNQVFADNDGTLTKFIQFRDRYFYPNPNIDLAMRLAVLKDLNDLIEKWQYTVYQDGISSYMELGLVARLEEWKNVLEEMFSNN